MIRPKDPSIRTPTLTYMNGIDSAEAIRRILQLAFRDAYTVLDLTYGAGNFWNMYLMPPYIKMFSNNIEIDPRTPSDNHFDFTDIPLGDETVDMCILDPPHQADAGKDSIMKERYGTVRGTSALKKLIAEGTAEAWRVSKVGIIVKITDAAHGGELVLLSDVVKKVIPIQPYTVLHTVRSTYIEDTKHIAERTTRNNGATYLAFRKDGHRHRDFQKMYLEEWMEQEMKKK